MSEYLGEMHVVKHACGHVVAACWVAGNETDAKLFKARHQRAGNTVETIKRYAGDPMPEWCFHGCERKEPRHDA